MGSSHALFLQPSYHWSTGNEREPMAQAKCSVYSRHISTARTEDTCSNVAVTFRVADSKAGIRRKYQINFADLKPQEGN